MTNKKRYFAKVKLNDGRVMIMNNNWFMAKNQDEAEKRAKTMFEDMTILEVKLSS